MAKPTEYVKHIESYVDSSSSPSQQAASVDALAILLKNDLLTLEALVRELDLYLTTTDSIIRSRGILLLGELLTQLELKPLSDAAIHSLIGFLTERLEDWRALRGALVGCLALLRRKTDVGVVTENDAEAVMKSYMQYLQVQSMGQHDRKLCFELLECLLERYPNAVQPLGNELFYSICEGIDEEKDPQCLILAFHIVEVAAKLFPDPSGPFASYAADIFEILGRYFPIHFTHPKSEDIGVSRDELSRALLLAFAATPLFEPFAIPLLLDKLSSSLPSAKVESFKYLGYCAPMYGSDRMAKHGGALWSSVKDVLYTSPQSALSVESESDGGMIFEESDIMVEALILLEGLIEQNSDLLLDMILGDEDINNFICSFPKPWDIHDTPLQLRQQLHSVGRLLAVSAKSSMASCNRVFEKFFPQIMEALGCSVGNHSDESFATEDRALSSRFNYVKGLQLLATFPRSFAPVSLLLFENILLKLVSAITSNFDKKFSWGLELKALVEIGLYIEGYQESEKAATFARIVVDKFVSWISSDEPAMPLSLKMQAICETGMTGISNMLRIVQGMEKAISAKFTQAYVDGNFESVELVIKVLECYSARVLPWFEMNGGSEEVAWNLAAIIWDKIDNSSSVNLTVQNYELLGAAMTAMKQAVRCCSQESQEKIVNRAFRVLSASTLFPLKDSPFATSLSNSEDLYLNHHVDRVSCRDEWIISLYASVVIALRPQTHVQNLKVVLQLFILALTKGHIPSAQALGSLVNKLPSKTNERHLSQEYGVEEAIDVILTSSIWNFCQSNTLRKCSLFGGGNEIHNTKCLAGLNHTSVHISAIVGLAWIGKGLIMRGHEGIKDITMTFLGVLLENTNNGDFPESCDPIEGKEQEVIPLMKSAADAFHILLSDSEDCLNRNYHSVIRPLYKQRFYNSVMPLLLSSTRQSNSIITRSMLFRSFAHVISETPLSAMISEANKLIPLLLDSLSTLTEDVMHKDVIYNVILVLSAILMDKNGQVAVLENAQAIINQLIGLAAYPHMMVIRETAIQCLVAMSELPYARIYPLRTKVLQAISKALDDPKRAVRQEAVRCRQAWASIASRSLHF
ncbi:MMS19 nucleotide excision repair protein homolog isoform X3 [Coffea eugenioides]|uniref:MMS19 nucleotide excision repair protein homolog isoform X3 n=1 Tax=Coffea eugenioides TaxID=49369 RepID=UPI000F60D8AA|nr:MMS19 nucleotide excision repair protein homolog isoform X3 [Coffea eugenioides]